MSKIGKQAISLPENVKVLMKDGFVFVEGPKGKLDFKVSDSLSVKINDNLLSVVPKSNVKNIRPLWGLSRAIINNLVVGVSSGFLKKLEINGVGYKAVMDDRLLILTLGYSHEIMYPVPENIEIKVEKNNVFISGIDKQLVGQVAADIRSLRKPEPYKGKGIKYADEIIVRKEGKKK
jgi:large subunit ribosomal protein L6